MRSPPSAIGTIARLSFLRRVRVRAAVFGALIAIFVLLGFFPQRYEAATTLTPTDPQSLGLSGTLGQLGALNSVFGQQAAVEVALRVARSEMVRDLVIDQLHLAKRLNEPNRIRLHRWLEDKLDIRSLRGGIVLIDMDNRDPTLAKDVVGAVANATQERLAQISRTQTAYKRDVLVKLVEDASQELRVAQARYDSFRIRNRTASPMASVEAVSETIPQLQGAIKAKQVELAAARKMYTNDNNVVVQLNAELTALEQQLAQVRATNPAEDASVGRAISASSQLFKLERDLGIARALYDSYLRYLQGTAVEDLTSTANIRVLEPAYVETERQIYLPAIAAAIAFALLWAAIEFYRLRPPPGSRLETAETQEGDA